MKTVVQNNEDRGLGREVVTTCSGTVKLTSDRGFLSVMFQTVFCWWEARHMVLKDWQ